MMNESVFSAKGHNISKAQDQAARFLLTDARGYSLNNRGSWRLESHSMPRAPPSLEFQKLKTRLIPIPNFHRQALTFGAVVNLNLRVFTGPRLSALGRLTLESQSRACNLLTPFP